MVDLLGMAAGHTYYYLEDVYPHARNGRRLIATPAIVRALFPTEAIRPAPAAAPVIVPGGAVAVAQQPDLNERPHME